MPPVPGSPSKASSRNWVAGLAGVCALWAVPGAAVAQPLAAAPTITSIAPAEGPTAGGTVVTIDGSGFKPGMLVWIGAQAHSVTVRSETQLTAVTPTAPPGEYEVVVRAGGASSLTGPGYVFVAPLVRKPPPPHLPQATLGPEPPAPPPASEGEGSAEEESEGCAGEEPCGASPQQASQRASVVGWGRDSTGGLGAGYKGAAQGPVATLLPAGVRQVVTAGSSYAVMEDGSVYAWGDDSFGELGDGTHQNTAVPVRVKGVSNAVALAAGGLHAIALLANGTVMTWGGATFGQMGNGTSYPGREVGEANPTLVPGLSGVVAVAAGGADDAALLANGTVMAWGENKSGQLGDGTIAEKDVPTLVRGLSGVKAIAIGGDPSIGAHLLALLDNGTVMAVGGNYSGQLGDASTAKLSRTPVQVEGLSHVTQIAADLTHSMALLEGGTVTTWGSDSYRQLGVSGTHEKCYGAPCSRVPLTVAGLSDVSAISAGYRFSLAIGAGKAYAWGWNQHHQLGQLQDGPDFAAAPIQVPGISRVDQISAGGYHSLALIEQSAPATTLEVTPGIGQLTVHWLAGEEPQPWLVRWRPAGVHNKWTPAIRLPVSARSYTVAGLSAQPYEVLVRNRNFGSKKIRGTPLGG